MASHPPAGTRPQTRLMTLSLGCAHSLQFLLVLLCVFVFLLGTQGRRKIKTCFTSSNPLRLDPLLALQRAGPPSGTRSGFCFCFLNNWAMLQSMPPLRCREGVASEPGSSLGDFYLICCCNEQLLDAHITQKPPATHNKAVGSFKSGL